MTWVRRTDPAPPFWPYPPRRAAARRCGILWAALIETRWSAMVGTFRGIGGVEMGGTRRERVGMAWTRRRALRMARREMARRGGWTSPSASLSPPVSQ